MSTKTRDMTQREFDAKCKQYDFRYCGGPFGYYSLPAGNHSMHVSIYNADPSRRAKLAYLIEQNHRHEQRLEREAAAKDTTP